MRFHSAFAILALFAISARTSPLKAKRQWVGAGATFSQTEQSDSNQYQASESQEMAQESAEAGANSGSYNQADSELSSAFS